ncbi:MAG TPA: hypothetical protein VFU46_13420 [Gemmatimonadales bacterium]|nr:hypothetical protein [Gemmatimonadales bacterium]
MLRLTRLAGDPNLVRIKAEGTITQAWVPVLEQELASAFGDAARVEIDFRDVAYVDRSGVAYLRQLPRERFEIVNCTPVLGELLNRELA